MSCGGWSFTPDGTFDSVWDCVGPMTGSTPSIISSTKGTLGVSACWVTGLQQRRNLR